MHLSPLLADLYIATTGAHMGLQYSLTAPLAYDTAMHCYAWLYITHVRISISNLRSMIV